MKGNVEVMSDRERQEEKTLRELGVPDELRKEFEATFKALGKTRGDKIVGFTFVTPEGTRHRLRLEQDPSDPAGERAA
jgi:tRNA A37 methylthiotransferase MiaB